MTVFSEMIDEYDAFPDVIDIGGEEHLTKKGVFWSQLWGVCESYTEIGDSEQLPLVEALTCAALFDLDPADGLKFLRLNQIDYPVGFVGELVSATEELVGLMTIVPPDGSAVALPTPEGTFYKETNFRNN